MTEGPGTVSVNVDGRILRVRDGISVAAALMNADLLSFRRSVTGEPRGPLCGMGSCHECAVTIDGIPDRRSCLVTVVDGMEIRTPDGSGDG